MPTFIKSYVTHVRSVPRRSAFSYWKRKKAGTAGYEATFSPYNKGKNSVPLHCFPLIIREKTVYPYTLFPLIIREKTVYPYTLFPLIISEKQCPPTLFPPL